jgi:hypothetical protein
MCLVAKAFYVISNASFARQSSTQQHCAPRLLTLHSLMLPRACLLLFLHLCCLLLQICAASNYGGVCFTQPLKVFVYSADAVRDLGDFDVTAAAAAAAAGLDVAAAAAAAAGRGGSMSDNSSCSDDSMSGCCEQLLPCVALLQGLELMGDARSDKIVITTPETPDITEDNSADDISCDSASCGVQKAAAAEGDVSDAGDGMVMGSCLDLAGLGAGVVADAAVLCDVEPTANGCGLLLLPAGSGSENGTANNFDCMSVASEATGLVGEGCGGSSAAAAVEAEMGEVTSACV